MIDFTGTPDRTGVREAAQRTFARHLELLSAGRIPEWVALFTEDGVLEFPYGPTGYPDHITGHAALSAYMAKFPTTFQVSFTGLIFHETTDTSLVVAEFTSVGTALATGRPYNQRYISVVTTRDGLISRYVDFWNPLVAMAALSGTAADFVKAFDG